MSEEELSFLFNDDGETGNIENPNYTITNRNDIRSTTPYDFSPTSNPIPMMQDLNNTVRTLQVENDRVKIENENLVDKIKNLEKLMQKHLEFKTKDLKKRWSAQQFIRYERNRLIKEIMQTTEIEKRKFEELKQKTKLEYEKKIGSFDIEFGATVNNLNQNGKTKFENLFK